MECGREKLPVCRRKRVLKKCASEGCAGRVKGALVQHLFFKPMKISPLLSVLFSAYILFIFLVFTPFSSDVSV